EDRRLLRVVVDHGDDAQCPATERDCVAPPPVRHRRAKRRRLRRRALGCLEAEQKTGHGSSLLEPDGMTSIPRSTKELAIAGIGEKIVRWQVRGSTHSRLCWPKQLGFGTSVTGANSIHR